MHSTPSPANRKPLLIWLSICAAMVALMVVVGGLTRLTESGLSMVEWKPAHFLPPMTETAWSEEFSLYQQTPQYQKVNAGMSLEEFKGIFWLEYIHRLLGRMVGIVFFLPLLYFTVTRRLPKSLALKYGGIFLLGGMQGALGWYMVKSGLVNEPMVSPIRLAAHLTLACFIYCLLLWQWLRLWQPPAQTGRFSPLVLGFLALLFMQIKLGALVAGQDAGLAYDSFPTMNGQWIPDGLWVPEAQWWQHFTHNPTLAQFLHRLGALAVTVYFIAMLAHLRRLPLPALSVKALHFLIIVLILQITLGALTLIHHVPVALASLHQLTAILLLSGAVALLYGQFQGKSLANHEKASL